MLSEIIKEVQRFVNKKSGNDGGGCGKNLFHYFKKNVKK